MSNISRFIRFPIGCAALTLALIASAQKPFFYPSKGQTPQQLSQDEGDCYQWAKQSTGLDPLQLAAAPAQAAPTDQSGTTLRGAARGAAGGAAIGAIAGDAGKGAGVGAVVGTMAGRHRARENEAMAQQQAQADRQGQVNTFYRAQAACMSGRGYTVQ